MIFPTIAFQLSQATNPDSLKYRKALIRSLEKNADIASLSMQNQLEQLIITPVTESSLETVILIDALDECKDTNLVSIVLRLLADTIAHIPSLKFFITSRPEPHIRSAFRLPPLTPITDIMVLHEVGMSSVDEDIRLFLKLKDEPWEYIEESK